VSNWYERPGEVWVNISAAEVIEIRPMRSGGESDEEWESNPWWEVVARMPSGNVDLLTLGNHNDQLIEWLRGHIR
jgi:hypothetical protein